MPERKERGQAIKIEVEGGGKKEVRKVRPREDYER